MSPAPPTPFGTAATAPGSVASLRTANQRRVIQVLQDRPGPAEVTQAAIARATGLAPATVSNIVRELVAADVIETTAGSGRRGTAVRISRRAGLIAGVDVGLGLPTPIEATGRITDASILPGWVGVDPAAVVARELGHPVHVDNDANLGALAEHRWGAGRGHRCMAYVKVSSGVGCGLVFDGKVFRGGTGMAGELGHLPIHDDGPLCRCGGRGCLEAYCSIATIQGLLADRLPGAELADIVQAVQQGNAAAIRAIEDAGGHLGWGIAHLANLVNPTRIVIGGDLAQVGDILLDAVGVTLRRQALAGAARAATLRTSALGDRSSVVGALLLAMAASELTPA